MTDSAPTTYSNERAYVNSWLVYINGLQVPAAGVTTTHGVWQIPEASIQMVPDVSLARLGAEDRVVTQVFYCDQWYRSPPEFCLMFDGEIVGWSYVSTSGGRALSFMCVDYMAILTQLFFFFMSSFDDIAVGTSGQAIGVSGATVNLAGYGALYPYSLFSQGLADVGDSTASTATISRPIDFAYNIVRALIKAQHPNRTVPAANFFAPWCRKTNFHRRWIALPYLDQDPFGNQNVGVFPILRAVQAEAAISAVARMASGTGTSGSMWDMLREVLMTMMMEVSMIPTPSAVKSDFVSLLPQGVPDGIAPTFLASYFVKPQFFFGLPPSCNVFFPGQTNAYQYNENYATQPTRMYFNEEAILSTLAPAVAGGLQALATDALSTAYPEECNEAIQAVRQQRGLNGKNLLVYPEEFFKGPVIDRRSMPRWFVYVLDAMRTPGKTGGGQVAAPAGGGTADTSNTSADAPDAGEINVAGTEVQTIAQGDVGGVLNDTSETGGAQYAIPDTQPANGYRNAFGSRPIPAYGRVPSAADRAWFASRSVRGGSPASAQAVGGCVAPQVFPMDTSRTNTRAITRATAGSFFASRYEQAKPDKPERFRFHCGYDFPGQYTDAVYSTTAGTVITVKTVDGRQGTRSSPGDYGGNWVAIEDVKHGVHRYMHMDSILSTIAVGRSVTAGQQIGFVGNSAIGQNRNSGRPPRIEGGPPRGAMGKHLHYDVTSSGGYRLDYTNVLVALFNGRVAPTQSATQVPAGAPPTPDPASPAPEGVAGGGPVVTTANTVQSADTARNLFRTYAEYEYFRERYSRRQGSVSLAFNPYPVAGFPCMTFDRRSSSIDTLGYIMSVRQSMSPGGWGTEVAFSHGRTLQEMFSLMQRTYSADAARTGLNRPAIETAVASNSQAELGVIARPIGAFAVAPAEPLQEIRDVIQTFQRAGQFYLALFHQVAPQGADAQTLLTATVSRYGQSETLYVPYQTAQDIADTVAGTTVGNGVLLEARTGPEALIENAVEDANAAVNRPPPLRVPEAGARVIPSQKGVFYYPDIIDFMTPDGVQTGIQIEGLDSTSRDRLLVIVQAMRAIPTGGEVSAEDRALYAAVYQSLPELPATGEPLSEATTATLNAREIELRTETARSNLRGDVLVVPRDGAKPLFESYSAAMAYNGRPICTLDEYVDFLGAAGLREGAVSPGAAIFGNSAQKHPAPFYTRIRQLRSGPPLARPLFNTTNTSVSTDGPVGASTAVAAPDAAPPPPPAPTNAQELVAALRTAGVDVDGALLERLYAVSLIENTTTTAEALLQRLNAVTAQQAVSPAEFNRVVESAERAIVVQTQGTVAAIQATADAAAAEAAAAAAAATLANTEAALAPYGSPSQLALETLATQRAAVAATAARAAETAAAAAAAAAAVPAQAAAVAVTAAAVAAEPGASTVPVYPIDGVPLDFPQTRADWDSALEQYRSNVLTRMAPYR